MSTETIAFERCHAFLRRGLLSGGDIQELLSLLEVTATGVGVSISEGYGLGPQELLWNIDPDWPTNYLPHAGEDPAPRHLESQGPLSIYCVSRHATARLWESPLGRAFAGAGHGDAAITRVGGTSLVPEIVFATYRPRGARPFSDEALQRFRTLLPLLELALSCPSARVAFDAPRSEGEAGALARVGAYARLGLRDGDMTLSSSATALFHRLFDGFGPRGKRRVERAIRRASADFVAGRGLRVFRLRADVAAELALLPSAAGEGSIVAIFTERRPDDVERQAPFEELLSPTQRRVGRWLADGWTIPAIADRLGIGTDAVRAHTREVYRRLGITSRADLGRLYVTR